ncbi:MAG: SH3 domain-containing protein, partial [Caldilineaceae bacterium]|nr:SH3 domain-containing protein [Caldilineaceae bacterium]
MQKMQLDRRERNTQLDRRVRYNPMEMQSTKSSGFSRIVEGPAAWLTSFLLIPALIITVLLLPPINLWDRLQLFSFTRITTSGGLLRDSDGTIVSFPPEGVQDTFYAAFNSTPQIDFIEGQAGRDLYDAAVNLPDFLIAKSPIYSINLRGTSPNQAILEIPIPNDSLPYETLSIYSWDGNHWSHIPSRVLVENDIIEARLNEVPPHFMVMQTNPDIPEVTANLVGNVQLPEGVRVASEIRYMATLRGDGALLGEPPTDAANSLLLLSNVENGTPRTDLINNLLLDPGQQDNQINAVEQYVTQANFRGVVVDYRDVDPLPSARADFVYLMTRLADRLHALNKEVIVRVATPVQVSAEEWDTDGYDWVALSKVVDKLMVPAPIDPRAYRTNGEMDAMLSWATSMVERRRLQIALPVQSVETVGNYILVLGFEEAFEPLLGQVRAESGGEGEVTLSLDNPQLLSLLTLDPETGAYFYKYQDGQGVERTVYIEDASSISHKLKLLSKYNIMDVSLQPPDNADIDQNIWSVLLQFQTGVALSATNDSVSVAYTIYDQENNVVTSNVRPLDDSSFSFNTALALDQLQVATQLVGSRGQALSQAFSSQIASSALRAVSNAVAAPNANTAEAADAGVEEIAMVESKSVLPRINANTIVNVRKGPGTDYDVLGQILPENSYQAVSREGDWWEIEIGGSQTGWIIDEFVAKTADTELVAASTVASAKESSSEVASAAATTEDQSVAAAAVDFPNVSASQIVNLRGGPGTNYDVVGQLDPGTNYRILAKNDAGDWWQVDKGNGETAWIIGQLVTTGGDIQSIAVAEDIPEPPQPAVQAPAAGAPAAAAPAPVSAPTAGLAFGYGVQAHMVHTGQEGQVMAMTTGMGFNWVKQQIEWRVFEPSQGQIGFGDMDLIINAAAGSGVNVLFSVVNSPAWARESGFDGNVGGPPADPNTYASFVGQVAGKYCNTSLKAIEVWNEQNLHYEWGNKPLNASEYVNLLAAAYNAIKGACPSMTVISGALTPAGNNGGLAMDDFTYLEQMF